MTGDLIRSRHLPLKFMVDQGFVLAGLLVTEFSVYGLQGGPRRLVRRRARRNVRCPPHHDVRCLLVVGIHLLFLGSPSRVVCIR